MGFGISDSEYYEKSFNSVEMLKLLVHLSSFLGAGVRFNLVTRRGSTLQPGDGTNYEDQRAGGLDVQALPLLFHLSGSPRHFSQETAPTKRSNERVV